MTLRSAFLAAMLAGGATSLGAEPTVGPVKDIRPGYGVVESVSEVRVIPERSAAAGGSGPGTREPRPMYRIRVRMADGGVQYRDLDKPEYKPGDKVLLTNAGEVLPDE